MQEVLVGCTFFYSSCSTFLWWRRGKDRRIGEERRRGRGGRGGVGKEKRRDLSRANSRSCLKSLQ